MTRKKVYSFFKCYNFSTNYDILNLFILFDVEFNCILEKTVYATPLINVDDLRIRISAEVNILK